MKILVVTNSCHLPQQYGGSEISIHELVMTLRELGHKVQVISGLNAKGSIYIFNRIKSIIFRRKFPADKALGYSVYRGWIQDGSVTSGVREVLKTEKPDVIFVQGAQVIDLLSEICEFEIPILCSFVDVEKRNLSKISFSFSKISYMANSRFTADRVFSALGLKCDVIYPLIRSERYLTATSRRFVGFVNPHSFKGVDVLFDLAEKNPNIPFVIQESWPLTAQYKKDLLIRINLFGNISYREQTDDMRSLYSTLKILLVPSQYEEAWGRVVNEAQLCGIPVIASDRGGLPEAVGDGGLIVAHNASVELWDQALKELWYNNDAYDQCVQRAFHRSKDGEISQGRLVGKVVSALEDLIN